MGGLREIKNTHNMKKDTLQLFINKYSLNKNIESVKWKVDARNKTICTSSISEDKNVLSFVEMKDNANLESAELGINDAQKLYKLLDVLNKEVDISYNEYNDRITSLSMVSDNLMVQYVTADLTVIPKVPTLTQLPSFNFEMVLCKEFCGKFIKAKAALNEIDTFTILRNKSGKGMVKFVLGYAKSVNSNRISIDVDPIEGKTELSRNLNFSSKFLKEILTANSECENAILRVSDKGLAHIHIDTDMFSADYYLVEIKKID